MLYQTPGPSGRIFIVSGPSGSGKTSLCRCALQSLEALRFSISYTTRAPREGENEGVDYFFVSREEFEAMRREDVFWEWAEVHGNYYGTDERYVQSLLQSGCDALLDIDVQGARQIRRRRPEAISIMVFPPNYGELYGRLTGRGSDTSEIVARRLAVARREMAQFPEYDYLVINDRFEPAVEELVCLLKSYRYRTDSRTAWAESLLAEFPEE